MDSITIKSFLQAPTDAEINKIKRDLEKKLSNIKISTNIKLLNEKEIPIYQKHMQNMITGLQTKYGKLLDTSDIKKQVQELNSALAGFGKNGLSKEDIDLQFETLAAKAESSSAAIKAASKNAESFGDKLVGSASKFAKEKLFDAFKDGVVYINQLDGPLNRIRIATGKSQEEVNSLAQAYNNLAKEMSVTTTEVASEAANLFKQGLSESEVEERMKTAIQYAKISGISFQDSNRIITATADSTGESIKKITDILAVMGNASASGPDELGKALQSVANAAENSGISIEKSASWISAISGATQESAGIIGQSLNNIISRYEEIRSTGFNSEDSTQLNDIVNSLSQIGITATDTLGQLKPFNSIMDEVGAKFNSLSANKQSGIAEAIFGSSQKDTGLALLQNYQQSLNHYEIALNSAGAAEQQFSIYQESTQAKLDSLKASFEGFWQSSLDSGLIKGGIDALTGLIKLLDNDFVRFIGTIALVSVAAYGLESGLKALSETTLGNVVSTAALTLAQNGLAAVAKTLWATLSVSPLFWVAAATAAVMGLVKIWEYAAKANQRHIDTLRKSVSKSDESIKSYESERDSLIALQTKLADARGSKEKLLAISADLNESIGKTPDLLSGESDSYEIANQKIKDRIALLNQQIKSEKDNKISKQKEIFSSNKMEVKTWFGITTGTLDMETASLMLKTYQEQVKSLNGQLNNAPSFQKNGLEKQIGSYNDAIALYKEYLLKQANQAKEIFSDYINNTFNDTQSRDIVNNFIEDLVFSGNDDLNDINNKIEAIVPSLENLNDLTNKISEAKVKGISTDDLIDEYVKSIDELIQKYPFAKETFENLKKGIQSINSDNSIQEATFSQEKYNKAIEDSNKTIDEFQSSAKNISSIFNTINEGEKLSADTILDLIQNYPELTSQILNANSSKEAGIALTKALWDIEKKRAIDKLEENRDILESEIAILEATAANMAGSTSWASMLPKEAQYSIFGGKDYADKKAKLDAITKSIEYLNGLEQPSYSSPKKGGSSSKDPHLESFNKQLADLQYNRDKDKISEAEYYNSLEKLNNEYFLNKKNYLDNYRKYETEVYNARLKLEKDSFDNTLSNQEHNLSNINSKDFDGQIKMYREMQDTVHKEANRYRKLGYKDTDAEILELRNKWKSYEESIKKLNLDKISLSFQPFNDNLEKSNKNISEMEFRLKLVSNTNKNQASIIENEILKEKQKQLAVINKELLKYNDSIKKAKTAEEKEMYQKQIQSLLSQTQSLEEYIYNYYFKLRNEAVDELKNAEAKRHEQALDDLNKESEKYKEFIDGKLRENDRLYADEDYDRNISRQDKDILAKQNEINAFALDDSAEAQARKAQLNAELLDLQQKKEDTVREHSRNEEKSLLNELLRLKEKDIKDKKELEDENYKNFQANLDSMLNGTNDFYINQDNISKMSIDNIISYYQNLNTTAGRVYDNLIAKLNELKLAGFGNPIDKDFKLPGASDVSSGSAANKPSPVPLDSSTIVQMHDFLENNGHNVEWKNGSVYIDDKKINMADSGIVNIEGRHRGTIADIKKLLEKNNITFESGGYTGDWSGNDGRLALLHNKELVLNQLDTKNLLEAIDITKTLAPLIHMFKAPNFSNLSKSVMVEKIETHVYAPEGVDVNKLAELASRKTFEKLNTQLVLCGV